MIETKIKINRQTKIKTRNKVMMSFGLANHNKSQRENPRE